MLDYSTLTDEELLKLVDIHNKLYAEGNPELEEYEFLELTLMLELRGLVTPLQADASKDFEKVQHVVPIVGLRDTYSEAELIKALPAEYLKSLYIMHKYDGISIELVYEKGILIRAVTRGDGLEGDDVTRNVDIVPSILKQLNQQIDIVIYGEIIITNTNFNNLNKIQVANGKPLFKLQRSVAVSSMKLLDSSKKQGRILTFFPFDSNSESSTIQDEAKFLFSLGYHLAYEIYAPKTLGNTLKEYEASRISLEFPVDGTVLALQDRKALKALGMTATYLRGKVAFKFESLKAYSILEEIKFQVGATGKITPVAVVEPVEIEGSTVQRASLYNREHVTRLAPRIGDTLTLTKGGDIIPKVVGIEVEDESLSIIQFPKHCPKCDSILVDKGALTYCMNEDCPARMQKKFEAFCSKKGFNIEIGSVGIAKLLETGIANYHQLFNLSVEDIQQLEGFKDVSALKLKTSILNAKKIEAYKYLYALNIPHVGTGVAKLLIKELKDLEAIITVTQETLLDIKGIGEEISEAVVSFFSNEANQEELVSLYECGVEPIFPKEGVWTNHVFVITGTFKEHEVSRGNIEDKIKELGGAIGNSVTRNTNFLIVGEKAGNSKVTKATKLGTSKITYAEFLELSQAFNKIKL